MSAAQKERFDTYFKIFVAAALAFFGWLGARTIDQFDNVRANVETIRVNSEGMMRDIDWLKREINKK